MSGFLRENSPIDIDTQNLGRLMETPTPSVPQRAEKLLKLLHRMKPSAGAVVTVPRAAIYTLFQYRDMPFTNPVHDKYAAEFTLASSVCGSCWAEDYPEFSFILERYLCKQMQFLERVDNDYEHLKYVISPAAWEFLESRGLNDESTTVCVAMSFNPENLDLSEFYKSGIEKGLEDAGYEAEPVNRKEHLNLIDDEIMAGIRKSRFIVADLTEQRNGVYFEAGFAMGLGLKVVWSCEKRELEGRIEGRKVHFDVNHYDILPWEKGALDDFRKRLRNRVEANFGKGTFKRS